MMPGSILFLLQTFKKTPKSQTCTFFVTAIDLQCQGCSSSKNDEIIKKQLMRCAKIIHFLDDSSHPL